VSHRNGIDVDPTSSREEAEGQHDAARAHTLASAQGDSARRTHFRRQAPIGRYVVDFFCPAKRLIIEVDGGHHNDDDDARRDRDRQHWLEKAGYRVVRFWNSEITTDLTAVLERVYVELYGSREAETARLKHRRRG
jgi:very-short-patch-repair endonuclease